MKTVVDSIPVGMSTAGNPFLWPVREHKIFRFQKFNFRDLSGFTGWDIGPSKGYYLQTITQNH
jgi:hypothetical protein